MGFNAKAFATAFLDSQATSINERLADAKKYKEEQEDLARQNIGLYKKRKQQMMLRLQQANAMSDMGASTAQIIAYANSGPGALQGAYKALMMAKTANGGNKLHPDVVTQIMGSAEEFADVEGGYEDFIKKTSGLYGDLMNSETEDKTDPAVQQGNWFMASMGYGAKDRAKRTLREKQIFEGMTVQGLNDLARTEDIQQILPGATANLQVIPQSLTASERMRIFDNFDDYAKGALLTWWGALDSDEKKARANKYGLDNTDMTIQLDTVGSKVFEGEKDNVLNAYLERMGNPFTESLVLRSRFGLDEEEKVEGPPPKPEPKIPSLNNMPEQKELAQNYPDAIQFDADKKFRDGSLNAVLELDKFIKGNNLEEGDVFVDQGVYTVLTQEMIDQVNKVAQENERKETEEADDKSDFNELIESISDVVDTPDAITIIDTMSEVKNKYNQNIIGKFFTNQKEKRENERIYNLIRDNEKEVASFLGKNMDLLEEYKNNPETFIKKYIKEK